jgi:hypothetical protein
VEFVLTKLKVKVEEVTSWPHEKDTAQTRVLFFSDFSGDGPSSETRLKLAAMLVSVLLSHAIGYTNAFNYRRFKKYVPLNFEPIFSPY